MESVSLEDLDEVDLLLTGMEISRGKGNLILCSVASPAYRDKVIAAIGARFPCRVIAVEVGDKLISDLRNAKADNEEILIWKLPESLGDDILDALNNFRELFYDAGVPSLVFITPAGVDEVIWKAPDFWRYRGGYHILKGDEKEAGFVTLDALSIPLDFSYKDKQELMNAKRINEYLLGKTQDKKEKENILGELGTVHSLLSEQEKAIDYYDQALAIARKIGDKIGEGFALGNLGNAYYLLGKTQKAIENYDQALAITREFHDQRNEGIVLANLGNAYSDLGKNHRAIEYYEQALVIARKIGDRRLEGSTLCNLGIAHEKIGETYRAIEYLNRALLIAQYIGDRRIESSSTGNRGIAYKKIGETHKAIKYYEQALAIACEIGDKRSEGNALWNKSLALHELDDRDNAIHFAKVSLKVFEAIKDPNAKKVKRTLRGWDRYYLNSP